MNRICPKILLENPLMTANIKGSEQFPQLCGSVRFYCALKGSLIVAEFFSLPSECGIFALHIHEGSCCCGDRKDPFADAGMHYNPTDSQHPYHAGDLPSVFSSCNGYSWTSFYTSRFAPQDVKGRTIILHSMPDDYRSQPSGNAGDKIACGVIC